MDKLYNQYESKAPDIDLNLICGCEYWKNLFNGCLRKNDDGLYIQGSNAFLFYGDAGNGKTILANAFAKICTDIGYRFIKIYGDDFILNSDKDTADKIKIFFDEIEKDCEFEDISGFCIFVNDISELVKLNLSVRALSRALQKITDNDNIKCIIILTTEYVDDIPNCLLKSILPCHIDVPNHKERKQFFERFFSNTPIDFSDKYEFMAKMTEGFNYSKLEKIFRISQILLNREPHNDIFAERYKLTKSMFTNIIKQLEIPDKKAANDNDTANEQLTNIMNMLGRTNLNIPQDAINTQTNNNENHNVAEEIDDITSWRNSINFDNL